MLAKYIKEPKRFDNLYILTDTQIRDMEILIIFNERKSMGLRANEVIGQLMAEYNLSYGGIQKILYSNNK